MAFDKTFGFLGGVGVGAGLMYWLDPASGRRRRARTEDKLARAAHEAAGGLEKGSRDLSHRSRGFVRKARFVLKREHPSDDIIVERLRARLGRVCSHPGAIHTTCTDGVLELNGHVLTRDLDGVLSTAAHLRGVREVVNHLQVHQEPGREPSLQGPGHLPGRRSDWAPGTRLLAGGVGAALLWSGLRRGGFTGWLLSGSALGLFARALTNRPVKRLVGLGAPARIDVDKTIHVMAPLEEVFSFWSSFENFPRFMSHVKEVRRLDQDRYHWEVVGPGGVAVGWDAQITEQHANRSIAWRSVEGAAIENQGFVHFQEDGRGGTRIHVRLVYNPPAGELGHALAKLLGKDPKKQMDDDLQRFKSLLEHGKATGREETVTRGELRT